MSGLRVPVRIIVYLLLTLAFFPFVVTLHHLRARRLKMNLLKYYYMLAARSWGVRVKLEGEFNTSRPLLVVSNHCSYVDIPVLGSLAPLHFTPKAEIRHWPVIGYLCRLADCIFIDRNPRKTAENMKALHKAMQRGWMISLFPEGTTNDGTEVKPFRSSYFQLAEDGLPVQPVTVSYHAPDGSPLSTEHLRKVVWIDEDEFGTHLLQFLAQPPVLAVVTCHPATSIAAFDDRKQLAAQCHRIISLFPSFRDA